MEVAPMEETPRDDQSKNGDMDEFDYESLVREMSSKDDDKSDTSEKSNLDSNALSEILGEEPDRDDDGKTDESQRSGDGDEDLGGLFDELEVEAQNSVKDEIELDDDSAESHGDGSGAGNGGGHVPVSPIMEIDDSSGDYSSLLSSFGSDDSSTGADGASGGQDDAGTDEDGLDILDGMLDDEKKVEPPLEDTAERLAVNLDDDNQAAAPEEDFTLEDISGGDESAETDIVAEDKGSAAEDVTVSGKAGSDGEDEGDGFDFDLLGEDSGKGDSGGFDVISADGQKSGESPDVDLPGEPDEGAGAGSGTEDADLIGESAEEPAVDLFGSSEESGEEGIVDLFGSDEEADMFAGEEAAPPQKESKEEEDDFLGLGATKDTGGVGAGTEVLYEGVELAFDTQIKIATIAELTLAQGNFDEAKRLFEELADNKGVTSWVAKRLNMLGSTKGH